MAGNRLDTMLKITSDARHDSTRLTLEGRLVGPWVAELERSWHGLTQFGHRPLVVDLTGLTFVGEDGKALLDRMWRDGAQLVAAGCCMRALIEGITGTSAPCGG